MKEHKPEGDDTTRITFLGSVTATCWVVLCSALYLSDLNPAEGTTKHDTAQRVLFSSSSYSCPTNSFRG